MTTQEFVDNLTAEQYSRLLDIAHGEVPSDIQALSDDELLKALGV